MKKTAFKIFLLFAISTFVLYSRNLIHLGLVVIGLLLWFLIYNQITLLKKRLRFIISISLSIILLQVILNQTTPFFDRLTTSLMIFLKLVSVSSVVLWFTVSTSISQLVDFFYFLPKDIRMTLIMTFSFIPMIFQELEMIMIVQKSRGLSFNHFNFYKTVPALLVPLLHRLFQRSEKISLAIISRGYE